MSASLPTFGTGLVLAVVVIFLGGSLAAIFTSILTTGKNMIAKAETPWWSDLTTTFKTLGSYTVDVLIALAGLIIALAVIIEWYVAAKSNA